MSVREGFLLMVAQEIESLKEELLQFSAGCLSFKSQLQHFVEHPYPPQLCDTRESSSLVSTGRKIFVLLKLI